MSAVYEMDPKEYTHLQTLPGNLQCIDCGESRPDWGSPKLGILFCFKCSGIHRGLGTHISFVRSVLMDSWTDREMELMKEGGGNAASRAFLEQHGLQNFDSLTAREKYDSPQGELWRQVLQARVNGTPEPTELPEIVVPSTNSNTKSTGKKKMEGFGSSPPPRETNDRAKDIKRCLYVTATVVLGAAIWVVVPH